MTFSVTDIAANAFNNCADDLVIKANCDSYAANYAKLYGIDAEITQSWQNRYNGLAKKSY